MSEEESNESFGDRIRTEDNIKPKEKEMTFGNYTGFCKACGNQIRDFAYVDKKVKCPTCEYIINLK